ncbi:MAG TPA: flagellar FlbD family protein [Thermotogota bacterium]|nr:flagellar FlbD family protein [Thermotogaceae bacterium]HNR63629.1 flagellar FlbD family protein [Thermotogota bacterium]HNT95887.1 flagellar FlbD family protein [Thermotogota bacterium]HOZ12447.1 flagellar FlbD family protein [Thermotogota bacterium]HPB86531.1 flagellar FlbD family protein [Thermotogota bacterium]
MIYLSKLNGDTFALNDDLIESIESRPDTTITLLNGKKIIVKESLEEVFQKVLEFRKVSFASLGALAKWVGQNKSQSQETKESGCDAC